MRKISGRSGQIQAKIHEYCYAYNTPQAEVNLCEITESSDCLCERGNGRRRSLGDFQYAVREIVLE